MRCDRRQSILFFPLLPLLRGGASSVNVAAVYLIMASLLIIRVLHLCYLPAERLLKSNQSSGRRGCAGAEIEVLALPLLL